MLHRYQRIAVAVVVYRGIYLHRGAFGGRAGRPDLRAPDTHVYRIDHDQLHLPVNARAGVPAAVVPAGVGVYGQHIFSAGSKQGCKVEVERIVAVIPFTG